MWSLGVRLVVSRFRNMASGKSAFQGVRVLRAWVLLRLGVGRSGPGCWGQFGFWTALILHAGELEFGLSRIWGPWFGGPLVLSDRVKVMHHHHQKCPSHPCARGFWPPLRLQSRPLGRNLHSGASRKAEGPAASGAFKGERTPGTRGLVATARCQRRDHRGPERLRNRPRVTQRAPAGPRGERSPR